MTIQSYTVLKNLKRIANNTETELCLLGDTTLICPTWDEENNFDYSKYQDEIFSILDELASNGYLIYPRDNKYFIALTSKGIHSKQDISSEIVGFLIKSVAVPVAVSLLTTLCTLKLFGAI